MPSVDNILQLCTTSSVPTQRSMGGLLWFRRLRHGMIQVNRKLSHYQFGWIQMNGIRYISYKLWTTNNWWNSSFRTAVTVGFDSMRWPAAMGWFKSTEIFQITLSIWKYLGVSFLWWASQALWTVPLKLKKNTLPMPWACCLMDPHPHGWFQVHYL